MEAARNFDLALDEAEHQIEREPEKGLPAPRPYPALAREGEAWIKARAYWIVYSLAEPPVILGVFHEQADIPGRYR